MDKNDAVYAAVSNLKEHSYKYKKRIAIALVAGFMFGWMLAELFKIPW